MEGKQLLKCFFLYANPGKPETIPVVAAFAELLLKHNCDILLDTWLYEHLGIGRACKADNLDRSVHAAVSFGGDGTLLRILPWLAKNSVPVLGVNMGHTGFLLELEPGDLHGMVNRLITGDYDLQERLMLSCSIHGQGEFLVMNELALTRGQNPSSIVVDVTYQDERIYTIHGDGVLVSTPTGTTGYSLSAGGPVLHPDVPCRVVVPVCSHIMSQRPVVLPAHGEIRLAVCGKRALCHQISLDGQLVINQETNSQVTITSSAQPARFIQFSPQRFLTRLHQKQLAWGNNIYGGIK
jgi:NAD+ kinase